MRNLSVIVTIFILFICSVFKLSVAQDNPPNTSLTVFNDYNFQPEVYSFPKPVEAGVGPGGNLNLSIPVLSIPGRGGFGYNVTFSYQSGIKVEDEASWIGLGWNFDPGSITRDVKGHLMNTGPDYADVPDKQPDSYFLKIPGNGTFEMLRANIDQFNQQTESNPNGREFYPKSRRTGSFHLREYQPYKIEFKTLSEISLWDSSAKRIYDFYHSELYHSTAVNSDDDIGMFIVTIADGTQYLYASPSLGYFKGIYHGDNPAGYNINVAHVNAWRLMAIIGPGEKFVFNGDEFEYTRTFFESHFIKWVLFNYEFLPPNNGNRPERYFLRKISTPTHTAEFELDEREDWTRFGESIWNMTPDPFPKNIKKLKSITLKNRSGQILKIVELDQDYKLAPRRLNFPGKLTLNNIFFRNSDNVLSNPGYRFEYAFNPFIIQDAALYGPFGYHVGEDSNQRPWKHTATTTITATGVHFDCSAWSLTRIVNPTGGVEEYYYESNVIANESIRFSIKVENDENRVSDNRLFNLTRDTVTGTWDIRISGGPRVRDIKKFAEADTNTSILIYYDYGSGFIQGLPPKLISWMRFITSAEGASEFHVNSRGKFGVTYDYIRKSVYGEDQFIEENFYYTSSPLSSGIINEISFVKPMQNIIWSDDGIHFVYFTMDYSPLWGKLYKQVTSKLTGDLDKMSEIYYSYDLVYRPMCRDFSMVFDNPQSPNPVIVNQFYPTLNSKDIITRYHWGEKNTTSIKYYRNDSTLQVNVEDKIVDGHLYRTFTKYAYDYYDDEFSPFSNNQLSLVAKSWTEYYKNFQLLDEKKITGATITTYQTKDIMGSNSLFLPAREYALDLLEIPEELPPFDAWSTENESAGWKLSRKSTFNENLELEKITFPKNRTLELFYGENNNPLSSTGDQFSNTLITAIRFNSEDKTLTRRVKYDDLWWKVKEIIDENDQSRFFNYDNFGRLQSVLNSDSNIVSEYSVEFSRFLSQDGAYTPDKPNKLTTSSYMDAAEKSIAYTYLDDWAREIQSVSLGGDFDVYTSKSYNSLGQLKTQQNNYRLEKADSGKYDILRKFRDPDGNHVYVNNIPPSFLYVTAGVLSEKSTNLNSSMNKVISFSDYNYTIPDTIEWSFGATFFNHPGSASIFIKKDGVLVFEHVLSSPNISSSIFFVDSEHFNFKLPVNGNNTIEINVAVQTGELNNNPNPKRYIIATAVPINLVRNYNVLWKTDYYYSDANEEVKRIVYPGTNNSIQYNHRFEKANLLLSSTGQTEEFVPLADTIFHFIPEPHLLKPIPENSFSDSYTYEPMIDHEIILSWQASASVSDLSASISISSNDQDFTPINETVSAAFISKSFSFNAIKGYNYVISTSTTGSLFKINDSNEEDGNIQGPSNSIQNAVNAASSETVDEGEGTPIILFSEVKFNTMIEEYEVLEVTPMLKKIVTVDEEGIRSYGYSNSLGQQVMSFQLDGLDTIRTFFEYDVSGNLLKVCTPNYFDPPNGIKENWIIEYKYNTLGQLLEKKTPDEGISRYRYDIFGKLIFSRNAKEEAANQFKFTTYDYANRPLHMGIASGSIDDPDLDNFTPLTDDIISTYFYDQPVDDSNFPTEIHTTLSSFDFNFPNGRLVASKQKSNGLFSIELYSYDPEGRIEEKEILVEKINGESHKASIRYLYNRQNLLIRREVEAGGQSMIQEFTYNSLLQLKDVFVFQDGKKINVASYNYLPSGNIDINTYNAVAGGLEVGYDYNLRNWITEINAPAIFSANYQFLRNGNINAATFSNTFIDEEDYRQQYLYDGLNRLREAKFLVSNGGQWTETDQYLLTNLSYDNNGNILGLLRRDNNSVIDDLQYQYGPNNKLSSVDERAGITNNKNWDAETTGYQYDLIGNVTEINKTGADDIIMSNYNIFNLPESMSINGQIVQYRYNINGQRICKMSEDNTGEYYLMDGNICLAVFDENDDLKYWNIFGSDLIGRYEP